MRLVEKIQMNVAFAMPDWLVYWATIKLFAYATTGKYSNQLVPELTVGEALKRWSKKNAKA